MIEEQQNKSIILTPCIDIVFKRIFGDERNKRLLRSLLDAVLIPEGAAPIDEIDILNPESQIEWRNDKHPVMDLKVRDKKGKLYHVEVQVANEKFFAERVLYYWSRLSASQLESGEKYDKLQPVYSIVITNFAMFKDKPGYHHCFLLLEQKQHFPLTDGMAIHFISLAGFDTTPENAHTLLDKWLCLFKEGTKLDKDIIKKWEEQHPEFQDAYQELERLGANEEFRWEVEDRINAIRRWLTGFSASFKEGLQEGLEQGRAEGEQAGFEKGEQAGLEKGLEQGRVEGEQAGLEKGIQTGEQIGLLKSAKLMLEANVPAQQISDILNISLQDIEQLKD